MMMMIPDASPAGVLLRGAGAGAGLLPGRDPGLPGAGQLPRRRSPPLHAGDQKEQVIR